MLKDPFVELTNVVTGKNIAADYASMRHLFADQFESASYVIPEQRSDALRRTKAPESVTTFLQAVSAEHDFEDVVGRALGVFDGQLYLWLFTRELNTDLTRSLFSLKSAIEQRVGGEFEIHVEPLGGRHVEELTPSGYVAI